MNKFKLLDDGLLINKISKTFGNKQVVRDVSISIKKGEIVGLLGPNGAGKTTMFYIIVGLLKPESGNIILDKINISNLPRPNFLAIDEGFGNMDSDNLNSVYMLFQYLKSQFQFCFIVSHIESMRDTVDSLLEIKKENNFSQIDFN